MDKMIKHVTIQVNGTVHALTMEEARQLYAELGELFGTVNYQYLPPPIEIPMHTPYKSPPIWQDFGNPQCRYQTEMPNSKNESPSCFGFQTE